MKNRIFIALIIVIGGLMTVSSQIDSRAQRGDKINAYRVAFLTEKMNLNSQEAEKFWPIYNEMKDEIASMRKDYRPSKQPQNMNDEEATAHLDKQLEFDAKMLTIKEKYYLRYRAVIPPHKLVMLKPAEAEFNKMVLDRVKKQVHQPNRKRNMN